MNVPMRLLDRANNLTRRFNDADRVSGADFTRAFKVLGRLDLARSKPRPPKPPRPTSGNASDPSWRAYHRGQREQARVESVVLIHDALHAAIERRAARDIPLWRERATTPARVARKEPRPWPRS